MVSFLAEVKILSFWPNSLHAGDTNSAFLFPLQEVDIAIRPRRVSKTATKETHVRGPQT